METVIGRLGPSPTAVAALTEMVYSDSASRSNMVKLVWGWSTL